MDKLREIMQENYDKSIAKYPEFANYEPHNRETWTKRYGEVNKDINIDPGNEIKKGTTVKIIMVSRFGDVGITLKFDDDYGYRVRIPLWWIDNLRES